MGIAAVKFQAGAYATAEQLINSFQHLIVTSTGMGFYRADIVQKAVEAKMPGLSTIILYSDTGFIIKVSDIYPGYDGEKIISLLSFCGFEIDDETIFSIINYKNINISLWK